MARPGFCLHGEPELDQAAEIGRAVRRSATIRPHKPEMNRVTNTIKSAVLCVAVLLLPSCSSVHIGDMPHWMGGLPADAPPRRGTPEYDAWMAKRAEEAQSPKTEQQQTK